MISRLTGTLLHKQPPEILLDVGGVGYELLMPLSDCVELPAVGSELVLHTHLVVREDGWQLYGFSQQEARRLFRLLLKANGVGPKLALAILSSMTLDDFVAAVQAEQLDLLIRIPGIGRKTAERLVLDLRDPLKAWGSVVTSEAGVKPSSLAQQGVADDVLSALLSLGYKPAEASRAMQQCQHDQTLDDWLRKSLQVLLKASR